LAEQRRQKEDELEEQLRLANQVHRLDEDEVEFLTDVMDAQRATEEAIQSEEEKALAFFRVEREKVDFAPLVKVEEVPQGPKLLATLTQTASSTATLTWHKKEKGKSDLQREILSQGIRRPAKREFPQEKGASSEGKRAKHATPDPMDNPSEVLKENRNGGKPALNTNALVSYASDDDE
jgi:hypothetical protein